jgi:hypothetical protein
MPIFWLVGGVDEHMILPFLAEQRNQSALAASEITITKCKSQLNPH